jgi:hypothetical protein
MLHSAQQRPFAAVSSVLIKLLPRILSCLLRASSGLLNTNGAAWAQISLDPVCHVSLPSHLRRHRIGSPSIAWHSER